MLKAAELKEDELQAKQGNRREKREQKDDDEEGEKEQLELHGGQIMSLWFFQAYGCEPWCR